MKKSHVVAAVLVVLIGIVFFAWSPDQLPQEAALPVSQPLPTPPLAAPEIKYPITDPAPATAPATEPAVPPAAEPPAELPGIAEADEVLRQLLALLGGNRQLIELFHLDHFIQRFVVTVDNLPRQELSRKQFPVKGAGGPFLVQDDTDRQSIHSDNARRYALYRQLLDALDSSSLVDLYIRAYPLFQQAYADLGHPQGYFNDRLVEVIDHLLETPELTEPILLVRPQVLYRFADPELERRSFGQKLLLRIGPDNTRAAKAKLSELRQELMTRIGRN